MIFKYERKNGDVPFQKDFCPSAEINVMPWKKTNDPAHIAAAELKDDSENFYVRMRAYEKSS